MELVKPTLSATIRSIREVSADLTPAGCLTLTWQGFFLSVSDTGLLITDAGGATHKEYLFASFPTYDLLLFELEQDGATVVLADEYLQTEPTAGLVRVATPVALDAGRLVKRRYFFSDAEVESTIQEFLVKEAGYVYGWHSSDPIQRWVESYMSVAEVNRMILWTAYWLVDKRRMTLSAAAFLAGRELPGGVSDSYKSKSTETITRVGDSFTIRERDEEEGQAAEDFTALWGDKYTYLSRHQLYIRNRLEKLFEDYSLRDNIVVSSTFKIEKSWTPNAYYGSAKLSEVTVNLLK